MEEKKSFIRIFLQYLMALTGLILAVIGIFMISSFEILNNEIKESSNAFLKIYSNEFDNSITELNGLLKSIASQKVDIAKIKSSNENERSLAGISLHGYLKNIFANNNVADAIIVFEKNNGTCLDVVRSSVTYDQKKNIREYTSKSIEDKTIESNVWNFIKLYNKTYLYKIMKTNDQAIAVYVDSDNLLTALGEEENGNRSMLLVNQEGSIGKIWGNETKDIIAGHNIMEINSNNYYSIHKSIVENQLTMYCFKSRSDIFQQTHSSMILVIIVSLITFLFILFLLKYSKKEIATPMKIMNHDMRRIKDGEYNNRITAEFSTREFQMLKDTTNQMIDEIVGLKIQSYEKKIELQDMELYSIRLQLRPHFFLNALTTISSLSSQNKNEEIRQYINALSRNIRYMFRAGFHTVTVREEIRHIINYFEMQELKYSDCIFYLIDMPSELEEWKIPQMLIHTFIENEYKYAVSIEETLTILIKISKQEIDNEEMLLIEIEDDGKGYPKEVLDYMNGVTRKATDKGTRIGLWGIKSMMELMYDRTGLVVLENITPHGCINRIYVPQKVKHERKVEQF
ncbi:histidine kinase [Clostridium boliviensis]|uniref:Histidine kinase n=1 Tax=Clostridium boliviensis TaxID=318465 RepID=A0ABU4GLH0_9CLOT|nr:histidine kinase [Clostridium boliviensis]MDW2798468.1 histidine kinase [Clostridium boliviensis]